MNSTSTNTNSLSEQQTTSLTRYVCQSAAKVLDRLDDILPINQEQPLTPCLENNLGSVWDEWVKGFQQHLSSSSKRPHISDIKRRYVTDLLMSSPDLLWFLMRGDPRREILRIVVHKINHPITFIHWCSTINPPKWKNPNCPTTTITFPNGHQLFVPMWTLGGIGYAIFLNSQNDSTLCFDQVLFNNLPYCDTIFSRQDHLDEARWSRCNNNDDVDQRVTHLYEWVPPFVDQIDPIHLCLTYGDPSLPLPLSLFSPAPCMTSHKRNHFPNY